MLSVIICDDEPKVCQLIDHLIEWKDMNMQLVGTASNGVQAFDLIKERRPDIVITDIRMPGMDELALVQKTHEASYDCSFVIISGHRNFEYAHNALKYNVKDYILKPIEEAELNAALRRIIEEITQREALADSLRAARESSAATRERLGVHFLSQLNGGVAPEGLDEVNETFLLRFRPGRFVTALLWLDSPAHQNGQAFGLIQKKAQDLSAALFPPLVYETVSMPDDSSLLLLLNFPPDRESPLLQCIEGFFQKLSYETAKFDGLLLTTGMGPVVGDIHDLPECAAMATHCIRSRYALGCGRIIRHADLLALPGQTTYILAPDLEKQLRIAFETLDSGGFKSVVNALFSHHASALHPLALYSASQQIFALFTRTAAANQLPLNLDASRVQMEADMQKAFTLDTMKQAFLLSILQAMDAGREHRRAKDSQTITLAKQYIDSHYGEPISLDDVAAAVNLNASYFSSYFKKETGSNFVDYLNQFRIDKAKALLINSSLSISTICEMVGLNNARYFSKLFQKIVGLKPSVYRRLYG